ncbi:bifunctional riboflavin kinase/FMN phosphatase [Fagus crenata]
MLTWHFLTEKYLKNCSGCKSNTARFLSSGNRTNFASQFLGLSSEKLQQFVLHTAQNGSLSVTGRFIVKMSLAKPIKKLASCVILDLDGTLLNTDAIASDVLRGFLGKYGKQWDGREAHSTVGKMPLEVAAAIVEAYELPCTASEFISEINPIYSDQWCKVKALPGANRLIKHLSGHKVPIALASNSPRVNIESKISFHQGWKESFSVIIGGDEVTSGKPSPEIFLEAAKRLNVEPSSCLVIEDSIPGVTAGKAAGMEVVAIPSIPKQTHLYTSADEVINSLLDLQPEKWGLPPFQDWVEGTLPIESWYIGGPVIKGFGRGSKVLGIPTANLSAEGFSTILSEHPSGVYFGWARLSTRGVFKMVMSIGWNPYFNNTEKTIEPWLLHDFAEDFYGEDLHLVIVGYIRPEANFSSLESLIAKIHEDRRIAERPLDLPLYSTYRDDPYLKSCVKDGSH